ncbi:hypothetical protein [Staphylococcus pseudoxylosus]
MRFFKRLYAGVYGTQEIAETYLILPMEDMAYTNIAHSVLDHF